ncbi:uncharacterized protein LOC127367998 [Xyrichtys novacula]|uniref:Uncharacterized protein LOC127367998 n=1 Tax=Xyrichtys novacula TaxID=13765 RepID=A0AAV1GZ98_XYRNO|nr:uncharacterized protein LOC127367998 [Xyrichtys novacula]
MEFKWIQMSLFLTALLHFTAAAGVKNSHRIVRDEAGATLPCENLIKDQLKCRYTSWIFSDFKNITVELVEHGQIDERVGFKSDRLSITEDCSLQIKKVSEEDAGLYACQQYPPGGRQAPDAPVFLSVVSMTEHQRGEWMMLSCSVTPFDYCRHTVKWLFEGRDMEEHHHSMRTSHGLCYANVTLQAHHHMYRSRYDSLQCEVTVDKKVLLFPFRLQSSGEEPGEVKNDDKFNRATPAAPRTTESRIPTETTAVSENHETSDDRAWWRFLIVSVGLSALMITSVTVSVWTRTKGDLTQSGENRVCPDESDGTVTYENLRTSVPFRFQVQRTASSAPI